MAENIHNFLENYFVEHELKRTDDVVRYVQYIISNNGVETDLSNLSDGIRNAVFRLKNWYESQQIRPPEVGNIVVFTDYFGEPHVVVKITRVECVLYKDFTSEMALAAGVEDGNVETWKTTKHDMIVADCNQSDITFHENIEIMAVWFDKLYPS